MNDPLAPRRKRKRSVLRSCGIGCVSVLGLAIVWFCVALARSTGYQPHIPPPPPMPAINGFDDRVAAGQMPRATGGIAAMLNKNRDRIQAMGPVVGGRSKQAIARLKRGFSKPFKVPPMRAVDDLAPYLPEARDFGRL